MATHDASAGTGGLDASIFFETERAENIGSAFNNTFGFFSGYYTPRTSASDLLALGVLTAAGACNGPRVELRAGRVDAQEAGPAGVPEPHTNIEETTEAFVKAGFDVEDMIAMVACGHALGGVHSVDFPDITEIPADPNNDTNVHFQTNFASFRNGIVTEYLDGSTKNPLVVARNDTLNSDKRVFAADGNKTMERMAEQSEFDRTCADIFTRMINTVPKEVTLTDPIVPYDVKPYVDELALDANGDITFSGRVRLRVDGGRRDASTVKVKLSYADRDGGEEETFFNATAVTFQGGITSGIQRDSYLTFTFNETIPAASGISKFWIHETSANGTTVTHKNGDAGAYPVDDTVLYQLSQSCLDTAAYKDGSMPMLAKIMVRKGSADKELTLNVAHKVPRQGVVVPELKIGSVPFEATGVEKSGYVEFKAREDVAGFTTFDISMDGKPAVEFQINNGMPEDCTV